MSITVQNITKIYDRQKALDDVSFEVPSGQIVGLLGPNGAGKSTLMKILTCFIPPTSGKAYISGLDVQTQSLKVQQQIGYLAEHNPLYQDMYVHEFLLFIASIHKIPNKIKRVREIIELTGLKLEQKKKIGQLSKGYRQRAGLAQAIIHNPNVLILDEPTSGLDPIQIIEIRSLIKELGKEKTVILSTHIMQEVEAICNRAIIIHLGKIIADNTIDNLKKLINSNTYIVEFDKPLSKEFIHKIPGITDVVSHENNKWFINSQSEYDIRKEIFQFAVQNKLTVLSLDKQKSTLEEVFRLLTTENHSKIE